MPLKKYFQTLNWLSMLTLVDGQFKTLQCFLTKTKCAEIAKKANTGKVINTILSKILNTCTNSK